MPHPSSSNQNHRQQAHSSVPVPPPYPPPAIPGRVRGRTPAGRRTAGSHAAGRTAKHPSRRRHPAGTAAPCPAPCPAPAAARATAAWGHHAAVPTAPSRSDAAPGGLAGSHHAHTALRDGREVRFRGQLPHVMKLRGARIPPHTHSSRTPFLLPAVSKPFRKPQTAEGPPTSCSHPNLTLTPSLQPLGDLSCPCATTLQRIPEGDTAPTKNSLLLDPKKGPLRPPRRVPSVPQDPQERGRTPCPSTPGPSTLQEPLRSPPNPSPLSPLRNPGCRPSKEPSEPPPPVPITGKEEPPAHVPAAAAGLRRVPGIWR